MKEGFSQYMCVNDAIMTSIMSPWHQIIAVINEYVIPTPL